MTAQHVLCTIRGGKDVAWQKGRMVARMWVAVNQMQIDSWDPVIFVQGAPCEVIAVEVNFGGLLAGGFVPASNDLLANGEWQPSVATWASQVFAVVQAACGEEKIVSVKVNG